MFQKSLFGHLADLSIPLSHWVRLCAQPRSQLAICALLAVLQRSPATIRAVSSIKNSIEPASRLLQWVAITSASLGGYHTVSGATAYVFEPPSPYTTDVGQSFQMAFSVTGAPAEAQSWKVAGNVPPGLTVQGAGGETQDENGVFNANVGTVTGVPTSPGLYLFTVQAYKLPNAQSPDDERLTDAPQEILIEVVATELIIPKAKITLTEQSIQVSWTVQGSQVYQLQTASETVNSWISDDRLVDESGNLRSVFFSLDEFSDIRFIRVATNFPGSSSQ